MRLERFGPEGAEKPAMCDASGQLRDLSSVIKSIDRAALSPSSLAHLRTIDPACLPAIVSGERLGACATAFHNALASLTWKANGSKAKVMTAVHRWAPGCPPPGVGLGHKPPLDINSWRCHDAGQFRARPSKVAAAAGLRSRHVRCLARRPAPQFLRRKA